jgi:hypothetical protein
MSTPNQPIYRRLLVLVTHSQNRSHKDAPSRLCNVVVMVQYDCSEYYRYECEAALAYLAYHIIYIHLQFQGVFVHRFKSLSLVLLIVNPKHQGKRMTND